MSLAAAAISSVLVLAWNIVVWSLEWDLSAIGPVAGTDSLVASPNDDVKASRARYHLRRLLEDGHIPGLAVAVARGHDLVWSEAMGVADVEAGRSATRRTRFRIHSLSKTLTASALMRLNEQRTIDLDVPVRTYVPSFPDKGTPITLRHLASHRSGIRGYHDDREALTSDHCTTALEGVAMFQDDALIFAPDRDSAYSNYGYVLLGAALERAGAQSFPDVIREHVLDPLQMRDTAEFRTDRQDVSESEAYDEVTPYSLDGRRVRSPAIDFTCKWPSGGFLSTADDMVRFGAAHGYGVANPFLRPESLRTQFQVRTPPGSPVGVAMGWLVARDWRLRKVVFNFGAGSGGRAFLALYPDQDVAVAVLANLGHARMDMRRLVGVAVPFLERRRYLWPETAGVLTAGFWLWLAVRRVRQVRRKQPVR